MGGRALRDDLQYSRLAQYPMVVEAVMAQKLVQEQSDLPVFQAFHVNLVSLGRNAALNILDMVPKKVYSEPSLPWQFFEVYDLLFVSRSSYRF